MADNENVSSTVPVSMQEVCDYMGFVVSEVEEDLIIKRNILRLISFSDSYLKGAIGKDYPTDDERAKQIALLVISDLYEYRNLDSKNISNTVRKIINDIELQLKLELRNRRVEEINGNQ
jgi:hypothetical protein